MSGGTQPARRGSVAFIFVVLLLDTLGIGLVLPVLPRLVAGFFNDDLGVAARYYGGFVALYATMQVLFAPLLGALSDRFGRRPVILLSLFGATLNYVLTALAPNLGWLFVGRILAGITGASFSAATAYIADITPPEKRAQSFGLVGAAFGLGFILGPALGGLVGDLDVRAPFFLAAGLNLLNMIYGLFVLPESLAKEHRRPVELARAMPLVSLKSLARSPVLLGLTGTIVCGYLAQWILQSTWALHTQARFGWRPIDIGISLAVVGVSSAVVQAGLVRVIVPRLGERRSLLLGLLFSVGSFLSLASATRGWMFYVIIVAFSPGGIGGPAAQAMMSREVSASEQGELQGSLTSLQSVCAVFGPLLGTYLFSRFAPENVLPRIPGAPFYAAALLNTIGLVLAWRLFARLRVKAAEPKPL